MYAPGNVKRQKVTRESREAAENFSGIGKIEYKPDIPYNVEENLYYRYYNATERIHGRTMEDWLRPSIFLGHAFTPYPGCVQRPWCDTNQNIENYKKSIRAMFELCIKLGIKYWSGYDRDMAPEGDTFEETQSNFEQIVELLNEYQQKTGIKPLWIGADLKNHHRYKHGAVTNSDANVVTFAGYQVKRALDIAHKLNAECFLFNGEQEGYENILTADIKKEMKHYARFLKSIIDHRDKIGYRGQLIMQTVFGRNNKKYSRYNVDLCSTLAFLKHHNFDRYFKVAVGVNDDFYIANNYGSLGCLEVKSTKTSNLAQNTLLLRTVIENGGLSPGGLTFYLPNENFGFEARDLAEGYIAAIDSFAKALRFAIKLINEVQINKNIQMKYVSFSSGWGAKLTSSDANLEECEEYVKKLYENNAITHMISQRTEHWTTVLNRYVDTPLK